MIDIGLLASIVIVLLIPAVFVPPWPSSAAASGLIDTSSGALILGLLVGRIVAVAIDDPGSLTSLNDLIVIRSGVEFWPGVLAGLGWIARSARRDGVAPTLRIAALTVPALIAWACYEATCLVRDGCPGPVTSLGLRPDGLVQRMFPIGLAVATAAVGGALITRHLHRRGMPSLQVVTLAVALVAAIRSVASIWLPHIGKGLTRQHRTSILVLGIAATLFVALRARAWRPPAALHA